MPRIFFKAIPYTKEEATLALESGVDGLIVPDAAPASARQLSRCPVLPESEVAFMRLSTKADEERVALAARSAGDALLPVVLERGWEVIPVENLLAAKVPTAVEAGSLEEAVLASGILERGVDAVVVLPSALPVIKEIVDTVKYAAENAVLETAVITSITPVGMGHRVCVDTLSRMTSGQGMLVGNSAAFCFLVNAETERNEYVASRPFRVNAGGVHAYAVLPGDKTCYLDELRAGSEVLAVDAAGRCSVVTVGRVKVERRPMLLIEAQLPPLEEGGEPVGGGIFLQNAETICLVTPEGAPVSVVSLAAGDRVLCRRDSAGRHFGMRIAEDIREG